MNQLSQEVWKDVVGYEGLYEVSSLGNVRSFKTKELRKAWKHKGKWLRVSLYKNNKSKNCRVHRLVAEAFIPNLLNHSDVNHLDCDPSNNVVENLEWCSQDYNRRHYELHTIFGNLSQFLPK